MPCYYPQKAIRDTNGVRFVGPHALYNIKLACGQCIGCRLERSRQWAARCIHEASQHRHNCFITITYAPEHLPPYGSLDKRDHQKFLKRLRKALIKGGAFHRSHTTPSPSNNTVMGLHPIPPPTLRYYMAGEYGERLHRPHYHFCLFGIDFSDKKYWQTTPAGSKIYRSPTLEKLWPYGHSTVGALTFESAAYTARYVMKKINGQKQKTHYEKIDHETGEIINLQPEYNEMSRAQGIGKTWIEKYAADAYNALPGKIIIRGKTSNTPRYYDKQLKRWDKDKYDIIIHHRKTEGSKQAQDNTPRRLAVKEQVAHAKIGKLLRTI
jgi:hypothetical protein